MWQRGQKAEAVPSCRVALGTVPRCFHALGLLRTLDASVPLGAQAGLGKAWLNRGQVAWLGPGHLGWKRL